MSSIIAFLYERSAADITHVNINDSMGQLGQTFKAISRAGVA